MHFLPAEVEAYADFHTAPEAPLLARLARETRAKVHHARMLSGHAQGRLLSLFAKLIRPRQILELGTYTGYSALCLAEGLAEGGMLHTVDQNDELQAMVTGYIAEAGLQDRIRCYWGRPAVDVLPALTGPFELVFIDADKENNAVYFDLVIDKVPPGGLIIVDNVLWSGKALPSYPHPPDKDTRAVRAFNDSIMEDLRVEQIFLPLRDGLLLLRKRG
jgi:caffeoyl-CoA O-methyltransferase